MRIYLFSYSHQISKNKRFDKKKHYDALYVHCMIVAFVPVNSFLWRAIVVFITLTEIDGADNTVRFKLPNRYQSLNLL